jgi:formamidopyrimidine-DNA glycosylase
VPPPAGDPLYEGVERPPVVGDSVAARRPATLEEVTALPPRNDQSGPLTRAQVRAYAAAVRARRAQDRRMAARAPRSLLVHLKMSGRYFVMNDNGYPIPPRTRLLIAVESRTEDLLFGVKDTRRLARARLLAPEETGTWPAWLKLGPDALESRFDGPRLQRLVTGKLPIKLALLDQARLAGLGNIYVTELLHRIRVRPERPADALTPGEWSALAREMPKLLRYSLEHWTESCRWVGPAMEGYGDFRGELRVYDRAGEPCRRCGTAVTSMTMAGRGSYFCPGCQT